MTDTADLHSARVGIWFDDTPACSPLRARRREDGPSPARTSLLGHGPRRQDDAQILALIEGLPLSGPSGAASYRVGILNEEGKVYREVWLHCAYEALVFTARMHALGFRQESASAADHGYDSAFSRA